MSAALQQQQQQQNASRYMLPQVMSARPRRDNALLGSKVQRNVSMSACTACTLLCLRALAH
jgi:hypothetical protein